MLAVGGGVLGLLLALWLTPALAAAIPGSGVLHMPRRQEISVQSAAIVFNFFLCLATGIVVGIAPAFGAGRADLTGHLREGGRGATTGAAGMRLRTVLVGVEVALAIVLLAGAKLLIRTFQNLRSVDPGFEPRNTIAISIAPGGSAHSRPDLRAQFYVEALERFRNIPGVLSASAVNHVPLAGEIFGSAIMAEGRPPESTSRMATAVYRVAMPGYFGTLGIALIAGRDFDDPDRESSTPVAVINSAMARRLWPGENALGKRFKAGDLQSPEPYRTVIGSIRDVKQWEWAKAADSEYYVPFWQDELYLHNPANCATMTLAVRAASNPVELAPALRHEIQAIDSKSLHGSALAPLKKKRDCATR